uniref:Uncharacterized protein n=1 Tax=Onchocerca volvulus TaxID=6282 RepID=A0A8R1XV24_ONCVO
MEIAVTHFMLIPQKKKRFSDFIPGFVCNSDLDSEFHVLQKRRLAQYFQFKISMAAIDICAGYFLLALSAVIFPYLIVWIFIMQLMVLENFAPKNNQNLFAVDISNMFIYYGERAMIKIHRLTFPAFHVPRLRYQNGISITASGPSFPAHLLYFYALLCWLVFPPYFFFDPFREPNSGTVFQDNLSLIIQLKNLNFKMITGKINLAYITHR